MKLTTSQIVDLLLVRPDRYVQHDMGAYRMKEANGTDVTITEGGRDYLIEPIAAQMDDLMRASRLIRNGSHYRAVAKVYRHRVWDQQAGSNVESRRFATPWGIKRANGEAIPGTEVEIDSKDLTSEGWTAIGDDP